MDLSSPKGVRALELAVRAILAEFDNCGAVSSEVIEDLRATLRGTPPPVYKAMANRRPYHQRRNRGVAQPGKFEVKQMLRSIVRPGDAHRREQ